MTEVWIKYPGYRLALKLSCRDHKPENTCIMRAAEPRLCPAFQMQTEAREQRRGSVTVKKEKTARGGLWLAET